MSKRGQKNPANNITCDEPWALTSISSLFVLDSSDYILIGKISFLSEIWRYSYYVWGSGWSSVLLMVHCKEKVKILSFGIESLKISVFFYNKECSFN